MYGIIVPVKVLLCIRFNQQYIEKIEGIISERTTLRERKLEKEIEYWKDRAFRAEWVILKAEMLFNQSVYEMNKGEYNIYIYIKVPMKCGYFLLLVKIILDKKRTKTDTFII